ncbi:MAG: LPXTG cell wall anchor domain-containing protein [Lactobacillus sp.]|nr:LPXTG cell wall anchor domain-containing protein [Lactobacillus sp.]
MGAVSVLLGIIFCSTIPGAPVHANADSNVKTAESKVRDITPKNNPTIDSKVSSVSILGGAYSQSKRNAEDESEAIVNYVDETGAIITSITVPVEVGSTVNFSESESSGKAPTGWIIKDNQVIPSTLYSGEQVNITVIHGSSKLPDQTKTITRTVYALDPTNNKKELVKSEPATISRSVYKDAATGEPAYGKWSTAKWDKVEAPSFPGYTLQNVNSAPEQVVNDTTNNTEVVFEYTPNPQSFYLKYVDQVTNKTVGTHQISGKTGDTVKFNVQDYIPAGYLFVYGQTIEWNIKMKGQTLKDIIIYVYKYFVSIPTGEEVITHVGARADARIMSKSLNPSKIRLTWTGPDGHSISQPSNVTVTWATVPDTSKIIKETGTLKIILHNGNTITNDDITTLDVPVIVKGAKRGKVKTVYVGDPIPSAKIAVNTEDVDSFVISKVEWLSTDTPSTAAVGNNIPGIVRVTYSDGTYQDVPAAINVISNGGGTTTIPWTKIDPKPKPEPNPDKPKPDPTQDKKHDPEDQPKQPEKHPYTKQPADKFTKVAGKLIIRKALKKTARVSVAKSVNKPVVKQIKQKAILPQTGTKESSLTAILGGLAMMIGLSSLSFTSNKKKKN